MLLRVFQDTDTSSVAMERRGAEKMFVREEKVWNHKPQTQKPNQEIHQQVSTNNVQQIQIQHTAVLDPHHRTRLSVGLHL